MTEKSRRKQGSKRRLDHYEMTNHSPDCFQRQPSFASLCQEIESHLQGLLLVSTFIAALTLPFLHCKHCCDCQLVLLKKLDDDDDDDDDDS